MTRIRRILPALLFAAGTLETGAAVAEGDRTPALDALIKAAAAEHTLNVEWGGGNLGEAKGARALSEVMSRAFHASFEVNYTPGPSMPQMATRIIGEVKAGQAPSSDVYLGPESSLPAMMDAGVLEAVPWSDYFPAITPEMQSKNHEAVVAFTLFAGFTYNTQLIPDAEVPHTLADLFRPDWKGKLASTPYAAGFDVLALAEGDAKVRPLVEKIASWAGGLIRCGEYSRIASGEFIGLVLDCGQIVPSYMVQNGGPVNIVTLDDAPVAELIHFAVPKTSTHPNLAKLFAGFIATPEGQAAIVPYGATSHLVPGTPAFHDAQALAARGIHLVVYTPDTIAPLLPEDERLRAAYQHIVQGK